MLIPVSWDSPKIGKTNLCGEWFNSSLYSINFSRGICILKYRWTVRLSAPTDSCHHFDKAILPAFYQLLEIPVFTGVRLFITTIFHHGKDTPFLLIIKEKNCFYSVSWGFFILSVEETKKIPRRKERHALPRGRRQCRYCATLRAGLKFLQSANCTDRKIPLSGQTVDRA